VPPLMPLDMLCSGEWGDVAEISGELTWVSRMAELGIRVGSRVRVVQPGSPCILQVGQARLSLRGDWTFRVLVKPVNLAGRGHFGELDGITG
jgi:ferrous iron transport protein A